MPPRNGSPVRSTQESRAFYPASQIKGVVNGVVGDMAI